MWPWIKHWLDLAMPENWRSNRTAPGPQSLHFGYEKAGLSVYDQPIPWNAEAVLVEALVKLPAGGRAKTDLQLVIPGREPIGADSLHPGDKGQHFHVFFRLPPITRTVAAEVLWRSNPLGQLTLPFLSRDEFFLNLRLQMPTLFARLREHSVPCQTFVTTQCRGLVATALLSSPTSLVPLRETGLQLDVRCERQRSAETVAASLTGTQLAGRQALVSVVLPRPPRRSGSWTITWQAGATPLMTHRFRAIGLQQFLRSLRVADARFVVQSGKEAKLCRQAPPLQPSDRLGPCFFLASREAGIAGICRLTVHAQSAAGGQGRLLADEDVLITDGHTMFLPGTLDPESIGHIAGFELRVKEKPLGTLPLNPPVASFTGEGAFNHPGEYLWTEAAEDELNDRLGKLLGGTGTS